jgi:hypothetical protein
MAKGRCVLSGRFALTSLAFSLRDTRLPMQLGEKPSTSHVDMSFSPAPKR